MNISGQWVRLPHIMVACVINSQHLEPWSRNTRSSSKAVDITKSGGIRYDHLGETPIRKGDSLKVDIDFPIFFCSFFCGKQVRGGSLVACGVLGKWAFGCWMGNTHQKFCFRPGYDILYIYVHIILSFL